MKKKELQKLEKEISFVFEVEKNDLREFNELSKYILEDIKKAKEELSIEEQIVLNLDFIHFKLEDIRSLINNIIHMHGRLKKEESVIHEINHEIKYILRIVSQIEREFFPKLTRDVKTVASSGAVAKELKDVIQQRYSYYKKIMDKLKDILKIGAMSIKDIELLSKIEASRIKAKIS